MVNTNVKSPIARQLLSAQVVHEAQKVLNSLLPHAGEMIKVVSYKNDTLSINCKNSAYAQEVYHKRLQLHDAVTMAVPNVNISKIQTRLVADFEIDV